jgi:hypothetical protein
MPILSMSDEYGYPWDLVAYENISVSMDTIPNSNYFGNRPRSGSYADRRDEQRRWKENRL